MTKESENRLVYSWNQGSVKEWFVNGQDGLEHGFLVPRRLDPQGLRLRLAVRGSLEAATTASGKDATQASFGNGRDTQLQYSGLKAWDAKGRALEARIEVVDKREVAISVDDREAVYPVTIDPIARQANLKAPGTRSGDQFGNSVAISGDTLVVGAPYENASTGQTSGSAYVFRRSVTGTWILEGVLRAAGARTQDWFGFSVAISGDTVAVGAMLDTEGQFGSGAVYLYQRSGTSWTQQARLKSANIGMFYYFGYAVALQGDSLLIGSPFDGPPGAPAIGAAYVFLRNAERNTWVQQAVLYPSDRVQTDPAQGKGFGKAVALGGDVAVVGAPGQSPNFSGATFVYRRNPGTGAWTEESVLRSPSLQTLEQHGYSVAIAGDTILAGGPGSESAYVYRRDSNANWVLRQTLKAPLERGTYFGASAGIFGDLAAIGAPEDDRTGSNSGAVYVFERSRSTGLFEYQSEFRPANPEPGSKFGYSLAIQGSTLIGGWPEESSDVNGVRTFAPAAGSATVAVVTPSQPRGLHFVPVTPCRAVDTRSNNSPIPARGEREFTFTACGVPANAAAVAVNVTAVPLGGLGFVSLWQAGENRPTVSTLNSLDGRVKANFTIAGLGSGSAVRLYASDPTHIVLDVSGYFVPAGTPGSLAYYPSEPCRVLDTRATGGGGTIRRNETRRIPAAGSTCLHPQARAYALNFTVLGGPLGFLTAWPDGADQRPLASTLNNLTGTVTANSSVIPAGTAGAINVFATDATELIVDSNGYFAPPGLPGAMAFYLTPPCRTLDTRNIAGLLGGPVFSAQESRSIPVGLGACQVPADASAVALNATVVPARGAFGFLTLWNGATGIPLASTLNAVDGAIASNGAFVSTSANGSIRAYATDPGHLVLDVLGYFAP